MLQLNDSAFESFLSGVGCFAIFSIWSCSIEVSSEIWPLVVVVLKILIKFRKSLNQLWLLPTRPARNKECVWCCQQFSSSSPKKQSTILSQWRFLEIHLLVPWQIYPGHLVNGVLPENFPPVTICFNHECIETELTWNLLNNYFCFTRNHNNQSDLFKCDSTCLL